MYEYIKLFDEAVADGDLLDTIKLPKSAGVYVAGLDIILRGTVGSYTAGQEPDLIGNSFSSIEVEGNPQGKSTEGIVNVTPRDLYNIAWYDRGQPPLHFNRRASTAGWAHIPISFGMTPRRGSLGFPPTLMIPSWRYSRLDLKLNWQASATKVASTAWSTATINCEVYAQILRHPSAPSAGNRFIKTMVDDVFTSGASGDKKVSIPTEGLLRRIYVQAKEAGIESNVDITNLKLELDKGASIPYNATWRATVIKNVYDYGLYNLQMLERYGDDNDIYEFDMNTLLGVLAGATNSLDNDVIGTVAGNQATLRVGSSAPAERTHYLLGYGFGIDHSVMLDFSASPIPAMNLKDIDLILTQGGADAAVRVVSEHIVQA